MSVHLVYYSLLDYTPKFEIYRLPVSMYPDNSAVLNLGEGLPSKRPEGMLVKYTTYQEFIAAMTFASTMRIDNLYLPYVPGARQDNPRQAHILRNGATGDVLPTLEFTMSVIKMVGFETVTVMDPHSSAVYDVGTQKGLKIRNLHGETAKIFAKNVSTKYDGVIAPDAGAADRALSFAQTLGVPLLLGSKVRDPQTNGLSEFKVNGIHRDERYLVVDDICDGGGTFIGLYDGAIWPFATADLFVTHGLFTNNAGERLKARYDNVFTTDSLGRNNDTVITIPMVDDYMQFENAIYLSIEEGKR